MDPRYVLLLACFFFSGAAALLYQTAWSRELSFVFGTSDLAVAAVLAAYMGGLALGAAVAARLVSRVRRPVLVYGVLEAAIALCALGVPLAIAGLDRVYVGLFGRGDVLAEGIPPVALLFQLAGAFAILLLPTAFMGATLPLLARHAVRRVDEISTRVGLLYAINTVGAIAGTLCAAFWLMPALGLRRTVWVGVALNLLVFGLAALLARREPDPRGGAPAPAAAGHRIPHWILPAICLSGIVSFSYEVMWTRLLGHMLGASVQAFATMLASFLLGIALGSAVASRLAPERSRARLGFAISQLGIAVTSYAAFALADTLPSIALRLGAGPGSPFPSAMVAAFALLPVTLCIGATFPFAVRILTDDPEQASRATARVYAWNTVGAIAGALLSGFVLLPLLGFEGTLTLGVGASLAMGLLAALAEAPRRRVVAGVALVGAVLLIAVPARTPWALLSVSPFTGRQEHRERVYAAVGRSATVLVGKEGARYYLSTNGLPEAAADGVGVPASINLAHWLGALPSILRPESREVLVVGLGGGVALELLPSRYEKVHVVELEPEVLAANRHIAPLRARDPLSDPRVQVHIGDARGTLQLSQTEFDAIVSQPSHPWTAGASHLYTREFFSLVRSRLAPDGVFVQWIGMQFIDQELLASLVAALLEVFPHVQIFQPRPHGLLFAASDAPIDPLAGAARGLEEIEEDLARLDVFQLEDFAAQWLADTEGVRVLAEGVEPNTDDHNYLASRSGTLGRNRLTIGELNEMLGGHDPLLGRTELDLGRLMRALVPARQDERALRLAAAAGEGPALQAEGWGELARGRNGRAARAFSRALEIEPDSEEARAGLMLSRQAKLTSGGAVPEVTDAELRPEAETLLTAWSAVGRDDWDAVAALDASLAAIGRGDALHTAAVRARVRWRIERAEPGDATEAEQLVRLHLLRDGLGKDRLLHVRAALLAGDEASARGSLELLIDQAESLRRAAPRVSQGLFQRVVELSRELPPEQAEALRLRVERVGGARPARRG